MLRAKIHFIHIDFPPSPSHSALNQAAQSLLLSDEDSWDNFEIDIDSFDWDDDSEA